MDLILLCVCSIVIARCLERKMRVASVAHAILFIVLAFFSLFTTDLKLVSQAMINVMSEEKYVIIRNALMSASHFYRGAFSVLFIIDVAIEVMACIAAIILIVKGYKKFFKKIDLQKVRIYIKNIVQEFRLLPNKVLINNNRNQYLVLQQLRN